jgi:hypothetical protein
MKEMSEQEQNLKETKKDLLNIENGFEANPQIKLLIKSMTGIFLFLNITFFLEGIFVFTFIFAGFIGCFVKRASNNSINHVFEFISFIVFELIAMTN